MHCVDLVKSFHMSKYLQNLGSIQPRTGPLKFAAKEREEGRGVAADWPSGTATSAWCPP